MGWFRKKQKEIAETFVEDATEKIKDTVKQSSTDYLAIGICLITIAIPLVDSIIFKGQSNLQTVPNSAQKVFIHNNGTINIYTK